MSILSKCEVCSAWVGPHDFWLLQLAKDPIEECDGSWSRELCRRCCSWAEDIIQRCPPAGVRDASSCPAPAP
jgi:hypothetical protein